MACISPIQVKHKGIRHTVPCGKCVFCLEQKRNDWSFRLQKELKVASSAFFVTLTYEDEHLPLVTYEVEGDIRVLPTLVKKDHVLFMKKLRKENEEKIRFFMVGEYGSNYHRPHYHYILFNVTNEAIKKIDRIWSKGFVKVGSVTEASIHYTTKYCISSYTDIPKEITKPFISMSKVPGLGSCYIDDNWKMHKRTKDFVVRDNNGYTHSLPRFYKDKIFTKNEKLLNTQNSKKISDKKYQETEQKLSKKSLKDIEKYKVEMTEHKISNKLKFQTKGRTL